MSGYKSTRNTSRPNPDNSIGRANELNRFYARFDCEDFSDKHREIRNSFSDTEENIHGLQTDEGEVRRLMKNCNPKKAPGPDGVSPRILKLCADQLSYIFSVIFNLSFKQMIVPTCWKTSAIVPVPKNKIITCLNDFRPVALTSAMMKICERIVLNRLSSIVSGFVDPLQFAYQRNRSTDDALLYVLNSVFSHLDKPGNSIRLMFYDFSSAFNTIQPHLLVEKMQRMNVPGNFVAWIFNYLTFRPQYVRLAIEKGSSSKSISSDTIVLNTGAPQGTVLSPFLFTLYTADSRSSDQSCPLVKFADDTAQIAMIKGEDDTVYKQQVEQFVDWCDANYLVLNSSKSKEIVIDFRRNKGQEPEQIVIKDAKVERVETHKYLGVIFDNRLNFSANTEAIMKRVTPRLYCLRKLRSFHVNPDILSSFYRAAISSVLLFGAVCWGGNVTDRDRSRLNKITRKAGQVTGRRQRDFEEEYTKRVTVKARKIDNDTTHPLATEFSDRRIERSGRLRQPHHNTRRYRNSFIPQAVVALNNTHRRRP